MGMTLQLLRDDTLCALEPGHHAYLVRRGDAVMGFVASGSTSRGTRVWWAYRVGPKRTQPWLLAVIAPSRKAAVERMCGGRP